MTIVLLVDDNFLTLRALKRLLPEYSTYVASDVHGAMELFRRHRPRAVVCDVMFNEGNGLDLLEQIKAEEPSTVVVMMTGWSGRELMHEATSSGADAFVEKGKLNRVPEILSTLLTYDDGHEKPTS